MNVLIKKKDRERYLFSVFVLIQFWYSIVVSLRLFNFTFDSPWDIMLANVIAAV